MGKAYYCVLNTKPRTRFLYSNKKWLWERLEKEGTVDIAERLRTPYAGSKTSYAAFCRLFRHADHVEIIGDERHVIAVVFEMLVNE